MKMEIKMIALDLDGTTLNRRKRVSYATRRALKKSMKKGVHIIIATGRTFGALPEQILKLKGIEYVVTSNGAMITRLKDEKIIYENCLGVKAVEDIINLVGSDNQLIIETFVRGKAYIDSDVYDDLMINGSKFMNVDYVRKTRNPVKNINAFILKNRDRIENISLNFPDQRHKRSVRKKLKSIENITVTSSFKRNLEIGGPTTSKGEALSFLMNMLDVKKEELLACGDSHNDLKMIELAGIGVIMGNAPRDVKKKGDYVTASNRRNGVAKAIKRFVLK